MSTIVSGVASITSGTTVSAVSNIVEVLLRWNTSTLPTFNSGATYPARFTCVATSELTGDTRRVAQMLGKLKSRTIMRIRSKQWTW